MRFNSQHQSPFSHAVSFSPHVKTWRLCKGTWKPPERCKAGCAGLNRSCVGGTYICVRLFRVKSIDGILFSILAGGFQSPEDIGLGVVDYENGRISENSRSSYSLKVLCGDCERSMYLIIKRINSQSQ